MNRVPNEYQKLVLWMIILYTFQVGELIHLDSESTKALANALHARVLISLGGHNQKAGLTKLVCLPCVKEAPHTSAQ